MRLRAKSQGRGLASLAIGWKTTAGAWTASAQNRQFLGAEPGGAEGWREIVGVVEVPAEAGQISFSAAASAQLSEADRCWFDDAALVEVEE